MVVTHTLKCWPEPYGAICLGAKTFDIRRADRAFSVGDRVVLEEWIPEGNPLREQRTHKDGYTGQAQCVKITHIERGPNWGIPAGVCVLALSLH